jgi:hypothetical protein
VEFCHCDPPPGQHRAAANPLIPPTGE